MVEERTAVPRGARERAGRAVEAIASALIVVGLVTFLCLMWVANLPANALTQYYGRAAHGSVDIWTPQGWGFFAPNPGRTDLHIVYRLRTGDRIAVAADLTGSLADELHRNPATRWETLYESLFHATPIVAKSENRDSEPAPPLPESRAGRETLARALVFNAIRDALRRSGVQIPPKSTLEYAIVRIDRELGPASQQRLHFAWHSLGTVSR